MCLNLFLVGAPKCGTSSLFDWLVAHPQIIGTIPKETYYMMDRESPFFDSSFNSFSYGVDGLENFFDFESKPDYHVKMEATALNIYQDRAIQIAAELSAYIIIVIRDPAERIRSSFYYTKYNLGRIKDSYTFPEYVDNLLNKNLKSIKRNVKWPSSEILCSELSNSTYIDHIRKWSNNISEDKLLLISSRELWSDPKHVLNSITSKLNLDSSLYENFNFDSSNQTRKARNKAVQFLVKKIAQKVTIPRILKSLYTRFFTIQAKPNADDIKVLKDLDKYFEAPNSQLKTYFNFEI